MHLLIIGYLLGLITAPIIKVVLKKIKDDV